MVMRFFSSAVRRPSRYGETPEQIQGTWTATARGYNQVFTGAVQVTIAEPTRLTNLIRDFFNLD